ncbi:phage portal protein [Arthrobacter agilis]|uniref:phage portal protein n=1 Tax=Arthrobacter agilis TaxID=37921 RepID=UPI0023662A1E|nr:phage portal protein [Arthrobacter agilis]WDF34554.1 phage portal protein [Arthrobacter agilis]
MSLDETTLVSALAIQAVGFTRADQKNDQYYEGAQRLEHIGIAVPPELRKFETVANWSRTTVDSVSDRLAMRRFFLPGEEKASEALREGWDYNNLDSESVVHHQESMILGRGFVTVGANEEDKDHPLITVESPREITVDIDKRHRRINSALRLYGESETDLTAQYATLYRPDYTLWLEKSSGRWKAVDRDDHKLGRVPIVMFLNRRRVGKWTGVSEMADVIPLVDAAARSLTNLQLAGETHSVPQKYVLGMSKGDFVDGNGQPIPAWQAYFNAIWANSNKDAKVGQFTASDLKNFHDTVNHYAQLAASVTGLPTRYFGQNSVNPPAEGAIRADEARLILNVERKQANFGDGWGWVMALYERFRTGDWPKGNRIKTEWFDAGTPTKAQTADALSKLHANGQGVLSREGVWDELDWSESRKERERGYFQQEARMMFEGLEKPVLEA